MDTAVVMQTLHINYKLILYLKSDKAWNNFFYYFSKTVTYFPVNIYAKMYCAVLTFNLCFSDSSIL